LKLIRREATAAGQDAPDLAEGNCWQQLLRAAFEHAFAWLGFGAKTAVGYGSMTQASRQPGVTGQAAGKPAAARPERSDRPAAFQLVEEVWPEATLVYEPGPQHIKATFRGKTTAPVKLGDAQHLISQLGDKFDQLKKKKDLKGVAVTVRMEGNLVRLLGLAEQK
jgi:CRISPR-associated protein Cmr6